MFSDSSLYNHQMFFVFSSVTVCLPLLEWAVWWRMRPQYQPARQKFPLFPKHGQISTALTDFSHGLSFGFIQQILKDILQVQSHLQRKSLHILYSKIRRWVQYEKLAPHAKHVFQLPRTRKFCCYNKGNIIAANLKHKH